MAGPAEPSVPIAASIAVNPAFVTAPPNPPFAIFTSTRLEFIASLKEFNTELVTTVEGADITSI